MNSSILLFFCILGVAVAANARAKFGKKEMPPAVAPKATTSLSAEEMFRRYQKAQEEVDELNKKYPSATFGINKFSFMTEAERKKYLSPLPPQSKFSYFEKFDDDENITAPDSYNYLDQVTSVKDQSDPNRCGSCFTFAATGAVESQYLIHGFEDIDFDLSEEYVLECDTADSECQGGSILHAFDLYKTKGVPSSECVPYTGLNGTCPDVSSCPKFKIDGYKILGTDEDKYPGFLYKYGPIAIGIKAGSTELQGYKGGVLDYPIEECGTDGHAVLLVGYTEDHWIVKNSWGEDWGVNGYFAFKRGINFCGFTGFSPSIPYISDSDIPTTYLP